MTVSNQVLRSPTAGAYACNGSNTEFTGSFKLLAEGDVDVILTDVNGDESTLSLVGGDYTVTPTGGAYPCDAFTITTTQAYATGNSITLLREMDYTQPSEYSDNGPFYPSNNEESFDRNLLLIQQLKEIVDRCVKDKASATATTDPDSYLAACQAAQAAAEAAELAVANASTNLFQVDAMAVTNVTIASELEAGDTIDGVTLAAGDRVLLTGQTSPGEDGIYVAVASGAASRSADYPTGINCAGHMYIVSEGTTYAGTVHHASNVDGSDLVGTDGIGLYPTGAKWSTNNTHLVRRANVLTEETVSSYGATLIDDSNAAAARTTLGLGTMATQAASAVAITGGTIADAGVLTSDDLLHIEEQFATTVDAANGSATTWNKRALNTKVVDNISGASLASNQITLPAGTYWIAWDSPAYCGSSGTQYHQTRLYNTTDISTAITGSSHYLVVPTSGEIGDRSFGSGLVTIADTKVFELQHYTSGTYSLGRSSDSGATEVYSRISIWKVG